MGVSAGQTLPYKDLRKDNLDFTVTADGSNQVTLSLTSSVAIDCFVDWGDGTINFISSDTDANKTHTYSSGGNKRIKVYPNGKNGTLSTHPFFTKSNIVSLNSGKRGNISFYQWYYNDTRANSAFPANIGSWDVTSVTNMFQMFRNTNFNQDIGSWNMSNVTTTQGMFIASPFNQDIGSWNMSNVTSIAAMFVFNTAFNQDIGSWDTSNVTTMQEMFYGATAFDQDLSGWDFSALDSSSRLSHFMTNCTLSTANYDALLVRWGNQASSMPSNMSPNMGSSTYTANSAAATARSTLVNTYGWSITDGGTA